MVNANKFLYMSPYDVVKLSIFRSICNNRSVLLGTHPSFICKSIMLMTPSNVATVPPSVFLPMGSISLVKWWSSYDHLGTCGVNFLENTMATSARCFQTLSVSLWFITGELFLLINGWHNLFDCYGYQSMVSDSKGPHQINCYRYLSWNTTKLY